MFNFKYMNSSTSNFGNPFNKQLKNSWEEFNGLRDTVRDLKRLYTPVTPKQVKEIQPSLLRHDSRLQLKQDVNQNLMDDIEATKTRAIRANEKAPTVSLNSQGQEVYETLRPLENVNGYVGYPRGGYGEEPIPPHLLNVTEGNSSRARMDFLGQRFNQIQGNRLKLTRNLHDAPAKYLEDAYRGLQ